LTTKEYGNLFDGRRRPSLGAGRFEVRAALDPGVLLGSWPRSDHRDAEPVLGGCLASSARWHGEPLERRLSILEEAAARLEEEDDAQLCAALGLDPSELDRRQGGFEEGIGAAAEHAARGVAPGVALVAPHWTRLLGGTFLAAARELVRGRSVILASDPGLPFLADLVGDALLAAGLPPETLAILHGALERALETIVMGGATSVRASGSRRRMAALRRWCSQAGTAEPRLTALRSEAWEVPPDRPVEDSAREIVDLAFGRASTLSGQRSGQVGRVFCPERLHSRFTGALLSTLDASRAAAEPLPLVDRASVVRTRRAWASGLDQGATMIFGGRPPAADAATPSSRRVLPTVFTNVEATVHEAFPPDPMPVLSLFRIRDPRRPGPRAADS